MLGWRSHARIVVAALGGYHGTSIRERFVDHYEHWMSGTYRDDDPSELAEFWRWMRAERDGLPYTPEFNGTKRYHIPRRTALAAHFGWI